MSDRLSPYLAASATSFSRAASDKYRLSGFPFCLMAGLICLLCFLAG